MPENTDYQKLWEDLKHELEKTINAHAWVSSNMHTVQNDKQSGEIDGFKKCLLYMQTLDHTKKE